MQVNEASRDPVAGIIVGNFVKGYAHDGLGRLVRTQSPYPQPGSTTHPTLAEWDGTAWNEFGPTTGIVRALAPIEANGPIPRGLYVGGAISGVPGVESNLIARWDGSAWHGLALRPGERMGGAVHAIAAWDPDGPDPLQTRLYTGANGRWSPAVP